MQTDLPEVGFFNIPLSDSEPAVEVQNVRVAFRKYEEHPTTLKEGVLNYFKNRKINYYSTFDALSNVSFSVPKGQIMGIIGSNGAGKSTLLNVLSGVLPPTEGRVIIRGSTDSLRSLGAGFDSELNAVENIYLYGSLRGQSREEIKDRVPAILEFAELEKFSNTPIKYYSSGMFARLGFACAIDKNPDVLVVDEVLAVGDERFHKKCNAVFERFLSTGKTVVMVSHSMPVLEKLSQRIALLSQGKLIFIGDPKEAIARYRDNHYQTALGASQ